MYKLLGTVEITAKINDNTITKPLQLYLKITLPLPNDTSKYINESTPNIHMVVIDANVLLYLDSSVKLLTTTSEGIHL